MSNDQNMIKEARDIVEGLIRHQKTADNRLSNFEKQVDDLKKAVRISNEANYRSATTEIGNDDRELDRYVREDGSLRLTTEQKSMQVPGQGTIKVDEPGLLDSPDLASTWHADLVKAARERSMSRMLMRDPHTPKQDLKLFRLLQRAPSNIAPAIKRSIYDGAGVGGELIPDQFIADLYQSFEVPRGLRSLLNSVEVDRNTILIPRLDRGGRPYLKGMVTSDSPAAYQASTIATSQKSISMSGMACRFVIDDAIAEDSAIALVPTLQRQIAQDLEDAFEDALINGDSAATHQDDIANWNIRDRWGASGLGGSSDHRRAFLGMRAASFDKSTTLDISSFDFAKYLELVAKLGELSAANKVCIASPEAVINHLLSLTQVATLDKFGPQATVLSGQIGSLAGIPIVVSRFLSADMNASGLYDNVTKTKTGLIIASTDSWSVYNKRGVLVEQDKDITAGAINLVATMRATFASVDADATKNVAFGFNLA